MEQISNRDREILRSLAKTKLEYVNSLRNEEILKQWNALGEGRRESPTVRLLFSNFSRDVVEARLQCEGDLARSVERALVSSLVGRELFDDDTPLSPTFDLRWRYRVLPLG